MQSFAASFSSSKVRNLLHDLSLVFFRRARIEYNFASVRISKPIRIVVDIPIPVKRHHRVAVGSDGVHAQEARDQSAGSAIRNSAVQIAAIVKARRHAHLVGVTQR